MHLRHQSDVFALSVNYAMPKICTTRHQTDLFPALTRVFNLLCCVLVIVTSVLLIVDINKCLMTLGALSLYSDLSFLSPSQTAK